MTFETACQIISNEVSQLRQNDRFDKIEFNFFGGEPLLNFQLIQRVVKWAEQEGYTDCVIFSATSNGTLLTPKIKEWCKIHKESFVLGLSIDGIDDIQKKNRGTDINTSTIDFAKELWPNRPFKMTISKESLHTLADNAINLQKYGYQFISSLAENTDWNEQDILEYKRQLHLLAQYYLQHRELKPMHLFLKPLQPLVDGFSKPQRKVCGIGDWSIAYDYNGDIYPCISLTPIVTEDDFSETIGNTDFSESSNDFQDSACDNCILRASCPTCYGQNLINRNAFNKRNRKSCGMLLAELEVVTKMQMEYINSQDSEPNDLQKQRLAAADFILSKLVEE